MNAPTNSKPDPTVLTTDALRREIANLAEVIDTRLHCIEEENQNRLAGRSEDLNRAKETAQRLEREVESTALRLEKQVEVTAVRLEKQVQETALRLEKGVVTALEAVAATAVIHSDAHDKEHHSHERIHQV